MEDLLVENTIPHHATSVAAAEHTKLMVEVTPVVAKEETAENIGGDNTVAAESFSEGGGGSEDVVCSKRKRGRPRKQSVGGRQQFAKMPPEYYISAPKPRRGRPKGSTKNLAASLGGSVGETAGRNFTFHTITIEQGEDIVQRIRSFSEMTPDSICIMSASGTVSIAEVYVPNPRRDIFRYELTIVHLNGSHTYDGIRGAKKCLLSVLLADSEGRCYGGAVAGSLIAAGPTRVIIGTLIQILRHRKRRTAAPESATRSSVSPVIDGSSED
ncbi:hypothetical protein ABFS82_04G204600 [Erythranthe guttata]